MTGEHIAGLCSAGLGAIGTAILFFSSYAFEPRAGAMWGSPAVTQHDEGVKARNKRRLIWQRCGLAILGFSFVAQAIGCFL
jgi:hypothetical protein